MQTTLELDEQLLHQAMEDSGETNESAAVEAGLRLLVQMRAQANLRELRGKVQWEGNLDQLREGRS